MGKQGIVKEGVLITCAMLIVSAAVYFFLVPSKIVVGSISGLAMVLAELLHMQMSTITFILNVVLLMAGFLFIGKEFGAGRKIQLHLFSAHPDESGRYFCFQSRRQSRGLQGLKAEAKEDPQACIPWHIRYWMGPQ